MLCMQQSGHFASLGTLMATLVPRCSDPNVTVRQTSFDCVDLLLRISAKYEGLKNTKYYLLENALVTDIVRMLLEPTINLVR